MDGANNRWAHATYASFRKSQGGGGGWRLGPTSGIDAGEAEWLREHAPTRLVPVEAFDDFISQDEIDQLPRRFEFLPDALHGSGIYMHSVPAGKDATGRPGNVFTHAVFDHRFDQPSSVDYPIELYGSPGFLAPFRANAVNNADIGAGGELPRGSLDPEVAWFMVDVMLGDRVGALYALQDAVERGAVVLLTQTTQEAAYWVYALSMTMAPSQAKKLGFCTFDRGDMVVVKPHCVSCVPVHDRHILSVDCPIVDVSDPSTFIEPTSPWSVFTQALRGTPWGEIVEKLREKDKGEGEFASGLAELVLESQQGFDAATVSLARQFAKVTLVSAFTDPMWLAHEFPEPLPLLEDDRERFAGILKQVPELALAQDFRGELFVRWLEYGVRSGVVSVEQLCGPVYDQLIANNGDVFVWLCTPTSLENLVCAPALTVAWQRRFDLYGAFAQDWLGAPGATIHPVTAQQLGFAEAPSCQLQLTEIAARIRQEGLGAAAPFEYAILFREIARLQCKYSYILPDSGDELTALWEQVGEGLQDTGFQAWIDYLRQDNDVLALLDTSRFLGDIVPVLCEEEFQTMLCNLPKAFDTCEEFRNAIVRLVSVFVPFSQVAPLFSNDPAAEREILDMLLHTLVHGISWQDIPMGDPELRGLFSSVVWPDYLAASADKSNLFAAVDKLLAWVATNPDALLIAPYAQHSIARLATFIAERRGEITC